MKVTDDFLAQVKSHLALITATSAPGGAALLDKEESIARSVIDRIPCLIAEAVADKRNYAEVCQISEYDSAASSQWFRGERLFYSPKFTPPPVCESGEPSWWLGSTNPEPAQLIGAARLVFNYCQENELRPSLTPQGICTFECFKNKASWSFTMLVIRWQPSYLKKLLGMKV